MAQKLRPDITLGLEAEGRGRVSPLNSSGPGYWIAKCHDRIARACALRPKFGKAVFNFLHVLGEKLNQERVHLRLVVRCGALEVGFPISGRDIRTGLFARVGEIIWRGMEFTEGKTLPELMVAVAGRNKGF